MMGPIIEELQRMYAGKLSVEVYDVNLYPDTGQRYLPRQIPSQIFLDARGDEVFRHEGFSTKEDLVTKLTEVGVR
jgi:thioredoxin 1